MIKADNHRVKRDIGLMLVSVILAFFIWQSEILDAYLETLNQAQYVSIFITGIFFTSVFTTAPALIFLIKLSHLNSVFIVAALGAAGAVVGDSLIFYFIRDRLFQDIINLAKKRRRMRIRHFLKSKIIRFSMVFIGGVLIALPILPDETGLTLLGTSKITTKLFILLSFAFNFAAIYLIIMATKSLP